MTFFVPSPSHSTQNAAVALALSSPNADLECNGHTFSSVPLDLCTDAVEKRRGFGECGDKVLQLNSSSCINMRPLGPQNIFVKSYRSAMCELTDIDPPCWIAAGSVPSALDFLARCCWRALRIWPSLDTQLLE